MARFPRNKHERERDSDVCGLLIKPGRECGQLGEQDREEEGVRICALQHRSHNSYRQAFVPTYQILTSKGSSLERPSALYYFEMGIQQGQGRNTLVR